MVEADGKMRLDDHPRWLCGVTLALSYEYQAGTTQLRSLAMAMATSRGMIVQVAMVLNPIKR